MVKNKNRVVPSQDQVLKTGDALETTGAVMAVIGLVLGIVIAASGGNGLMLGLVPIGILIMISGHTKKTAAVSSALLILQMSELESKHVTSRASQAE